MPFLIGFPNDIVGTEYFALKEDQLVSFRDPAFAQSFPDRESASAFMKTNFGSLEDNVKVMDEEKAKQDFQAAKDAGFPYRSMPVKSKTLSRQYNNESPEEVLEWWIAVKSGPESQIAFSDYKTWPALYTKFECIMEVNAYHSQDYKEQFLGAKMRVNPDTHFEEFERELAMVLPFTTRTDEAGNKLVDIMDHELNAGGGFDFIARKDGTFAIGHGRNARYVVSEGSLENVFAYWQRDRNFESKEADEDNSMGLT